MRPMIFLAALALTGCGQSAAKKAEEQFEIVAASYAATNGEKCAAANKVTAAYLEAGNQQEYEAWNSRAYQWCAREPNALAEH